MATCALKAHVVARNSTIHPARRRPLLRVAADHLLRVWRDGGTQGLATALPFIHRDVQESPSACRERGETLGLAGFHAGVTRAAVVVRSVGAEDVEAALLALRSAER